MIWGAWFLLFVLCELPAVANVTPWPSLSATVWGLQQRWDWTTIPIIGGLAILAVHLIRAKGVAQGDTAVGGDGNEEPASPREAGDT